MIFCKAFLTCSNGRRADSAETMQPNCEPDLSNENKTKDHDLADDTQCTNMLLPGEDKFVSGSKGESHASCQTALRKGRTATRSKEWVIYSRVVMPL